MVGFDVIASLLKECGLLKLKSVPCVPQNKRMIFIWYIDRPVKFSSYETETNHSKKLVRNLKLKDLVLVAYKLRFKILSPPKGTFMLLQGNKLTYETIL